jgi:hypothetical protein
MARFRHCATLVALLLTAPAPPASAGTLGSTVKRALVTGGHAARDGALTFGRTTRDLFTRGPAAAKRTWKSNAARTGANARANARATRRVARSR